MPRNTIANSARSTHEDELIRLARELQRELTQRRKLKRHLRTVEAEIKATRRQLLALRAFMQERHAGAAPDRLFGGASTVGRFEPRRQASTPLDGPALVDEPAAAGDKVTR